jgi:hypothetical protein
MTGANALRNYTQNHAEQNHEDRKQRGYYHPPSVFMILFCMILCVIITQPAATPATANVLRHRRA